MAASLLTALGDIAALAFRADFYRPDLAEKQRGLDEQPDPGDFSAGTGSS